MINVHTLMFAFEYIFFFFNASLHYILIPVYKTAWHTSTFLSQSKKLNLLSRNHSWIKLKLKLTVFKSYIVFLRFNVLINNF